MFYAVISRLSYNKKRRLSGRWPTRPLSPSTETVSPIPSQKYFQSYRRDHRSRAVAHQSDQYLSLVWLPLKLAGTKQQQSQHFVQQLRPSQGERYRGGWRIRRRTKSQSGKTIPLSLHRRLFPKVRKYSFKHWINNINSIQIIRSALEWTGQPACSELFARCRKRLCLATDFWANSSNLF